MYDCFFCCKNKEDENNRKKDLNVDMIVSTPPKNPTRFQSFMNMAVNSILGNKSTVHHEDRCRVCKKEFKSESKICNCLIEEAHPTNRETKKKIHEKYIQNQELVHKMAHIDKNPEKLIHLVNDIYEIVERTSLQEDLTPKTMAKVKENLVNEICIHLEDYIPDEDE